MSDDTNELAAPVQPTDVRFSTRALLMVMVGVALAASALGPYFRGLEPDERGRIAALWGVCGVFVLTWVGYHARTRYQLERQAGRTLMALTVRGRRIRNAKPWVSIVGGCLWIAFGLYYLVMTGEDIDRARSVGENLFSIVFRGLFSAMFVALGIATIWWNQKIQLRDFGVLRGMRLLRWTHLTGHAWDDSALTLEGVDQRHQDIRMAMNVPAGQRDSVDALLAEKLPARFRPQIALPTDAEKAIAALPAIRITPPDEVSLRRILTIIAVYVAIIAIVVTRPWGTPPREFNVGAWIGFFSMAAAGVRRRNKARLSEAPLVRLSLRIDWLRAAGMIGVMLSCYYGVQHLQLAEPVFAVVLGYVAGAGAFVVFGVIMRDKFDLCENGVVISQWDFWPWDTMRVSKWNRDGNGRLVLNRGWRRILAKVPRDERPAVDDILSAKLGGQPR